MSRGLKNDETVKVHDVDVDDDPSTDEKIVSHTEEEIEQNFDSRQPGDWTSVYCCKAWTFIAIESLYIVSLLIFSIWLCYEVWSLQLLSLMTIPTERVSSFGPLLYSFAGGLIGGILFTMKWLYHSVARKKWHLDRLLWRLFTPWISGIFAFVMYTLMKSGLFSVFDEAALGSGATAFSIGFLVGYFSDSAMSKFREIANTLFGTH
ncbi:hypothetical protein N9Y67_00570 [Pseudomonadota bacterium]|nr:hypothetical protein [Pseudomonadota bacterium]